MKAVSRRLQKLENQISSSDPVSWLDVYQVALSRLCALDQQLVAEVMAYQAESRNEPHLAAWARLDEAMVQAGRELNAPIVLTANEMML